MSKENRIKSGPGLLFRYLINIFGIVLGIGLFICLTAWVISGYQFVEKVILGFTVRYPYMPFGVLWDNRGMLMKVVFEHGLEVSLCAVAGALICMAVCVIGAFVQRAMSNRMTTIHGSSRWATKQELKRMGMLSGVGMVFGQTAEAEFGKEPVEKPKRKPGETRDDFGRRLSRWSPSDTRDTFEKPGEIITNLSNAHTLIVGSTRSGKGVSCIIPTEFLWDESMIVFDPKAEGWDISSNFRSRFSYTFKFQPETPNESIHYNPLLSIRRGVNTVADIQNLCFSLIPLNEQSKDPFWDNEGRKLLAAVIGYVIYCEPPERKTFRQVNAIFSNSAALPPVDPDSEEAKLSPTKRYLRHYAGCMREYMKIGVKPVDNGLLPSEGKEKKTEETDDRMYLDAEDLRTMERFANDLEYFAACEDKQLSSVVSTMSSNLQVIADPNVQAITDRSDFTMEDFVMGIDDGTGNRRPMSLYLCMSLASMQRLIPIMKIFYEQAITLLTRCTPEECKKRPYRLLLIFDEFRQMGKMDIVEKALALSAGYGILCAIAVQSYDQLKTLYQSDALFTDNFAYQIILRVNDPNTCRKVEEMLGQGTVQRSSASFSGNSNQVMLRGTNISVQEYGRSLMTAEEVRTMDDNDMIIISSGHHPYKGKKIRYYLDDRFTPLYKDSKGKLLPPPPISENRPHEDVDKNGKLIGTDGEGWHELPGLEAFLHKVDRAADPETKEEENDVRRTYIQDEPAVRKVSEEVQEPASGDAEFTDV